ncbi:hypothetical protein Curi_c19600 [Gottschalkia acidurici 9a]|uniref:Cytochrome c oxidase subunit 4 n=1 Tax=Gottschalkia acidurici (strain ATCC 7906 / DSM 604 / BCRC 14475 / CIP 104303 / KCTC 5404 / NCIMB 10678 / 9a) TaxID=1128398 RepID=K0B0B0_GOTA9|nr:hypothetical protein [Gottschalkia acidurici]AFS78964.1 hypothetical protein Curi_c19600 [Gottschalkia acidurici 9a]
MIGLLNLGSLILGLVAWILPAINIVHDNRNWFTLSTISMSACAISLCFQIFYNNHLVKIEDWSALMDTTGALVFVASVLLIVTIILNAITLIIYRDKLAK